MNALEKAKRLIAGRVDYDTLCRHAAHNLNERRKVLAELSKDKGQFRGKRTSKPRKDYLQRMLKELRIEEGLLRTKERRIRPHIVSEAKFII